MFDLSYEIGIYGYLANILRSRLRQLIGHVKANNLVDIDKALHDRKLAKSVDFSV